ncbi:hypothetical protein MHU86_21454 [Fragilaria crotonensis]|nr:hypothetical protein MHU86_21454 [Fragilaria crotonensis]
MSVLSDLELDARLQALELRLGIAPNTDNKLPDDDNSQLDVVNRLERLEQQWKSSTTATFNRAGDESDKLLEELQPGAGLTYQQVLSGRSQDYPLIYRQQMVLASQDSLRRDMTHLGDILNLLHISQKSSLSDITQAPILNAPVITLDEERRLDSLRVNTADCQIQVGELADRMDSLIVTYQKALMALSNRMIQIDEKLCRLGKF